VLLCEAVHTDVLSRLVALGFGPTNAEEGPDGYSHRSANLAPVINGWGLFRRRASGVGSSMLTVDARAPIMNIILVLPPIHVAPNALIVRVVTRIPSR